MNRQMPQLGEVKSDQEELDPASQSVKQCSGVTAASLRSIQTCGYWQLGSEHTGSLS